MRTDVYTSHRTTVVLTGREARVLRDGHHVWSGYVNDTPRGERSVIRRRCAARGEYEAYWRRARYARAAIREAIEADAISALDVAWASVGHDPARYFLACGEDYFPEQRATDDNPDDLIHYMSDRDEAEDIVFDAPGEEEP